jgi:hypothetical protein
MLDVLQADFQRLPELIGREAAPPAVEEAPAPAPAEQAAVQLGLF